MRRADRLFQIILLLRGSPVVTAAELARELEVSPRTIYRDVQDLIASGVPIEGEAGVGYALPEDFDLPPLMFTEDEIEALVLGARMVEAYGDPAMAREARRVIDKVRTVLPERLEGRVDHVDLYVPGFHVPAGLTTNLEPVRRAISERLRLHFDYTDREGRKSRRTVRPLGLFHWGTSWTFVAWCEHRDDFRTFRPDRMEEVEVREPFPEEPGRDLETFLREVIGPRRDGE